MLDEIGWGLLHHAAHHGSLRAMRLLCEGGCGVNRLTSDGQSALHVAAAALQHEAVALLIAIGARPDLVNARGETPLHQLLSSRKAGAANMKGLLVAVSQLLPQGGKENIWSLWEGKTVDSLNVSLLARMYSADTSHALARSLFSARGGLSVAILAEGVTKLIRRKSFAFATYLIRENAKILASASECLSQIFLEALNSSSTQLLDLFRATFASSIESVSLTSDNLLLFLKLSILQQDFVFGKYLLDSFPNLRGQISVASNEGTGGEPYIPYGYSPQLISVLQLWSPVQLALISAKPAFLTLFMSTRYFSVYLYLLVTSLRFPLTFISVLRLLRVPSRRSWLTLSCRTVTTV